jgi:hypothetical protein
VVGAQAALTFTCGQRLPSRSRNSAQVPVKAILSIAIGSSPSMSGDYGIAFWFPRCIVAKIACEVVTMSRITRDVDSPLNDRMGIFATGFCVGWTLQPEDIERYQ